MIRLFEFDLHCTIALGNTQYSNLTPEAKLASNGLRLHSSKLKTALVYCIASSNAAL